MRTYEIRSLTEIPPHTGDIDGTSWEAANVASLDQFVWPESGPKPETTVRALAGGDALSLQFRVEDDEITAEPRELNGPVYEDSCDEFFPRPWAACDGWYLDFEVNCAGDVHLGWREPGWTTGDSDSRLTSEELAAKIVVRTSVAGPRKEAEPDDEIWWLAARLLVEAIHEFMGEVVSVFPGTEWRGTSTVTAFRTTDGTRGIGSRRQNPTATRRNSSGGYSSSD